MNYANYAKLAPCLQAGYKAMMVKSSEMELPLFKANMIICLR